MGVWVGVGSMFLKQVKHISSVGRFRNCAAEGDVSFKRYTLVFGENGRGKTTLCSILRSLATNNPDIIAGRKTLQSSKDPNVVLLHDQGAAHFKGQHWSETLPDIRIFDAQYVGENIWFGDAIGTDQRRNLCTVMLGRDGVALAAEYHALDSGISDKNVAIRSARTLLTSHVSKIEVDQFLALAEDADIEAKIGAKRKEVEGLREIDNLRSQGTFERLELPALPTQLEAVLSRTLEDISREAEAAVKQHLARHQLEGHESWLAVGMIGLSDSDCPFCGQSTRGLDLIAAYRSYFNASYAALRAELTRYQQLPAKHYSDDRVQLLLARRETNANSGAIWTRYVGITVPTLDLDVAGPLTAFREEMQSLLETKAAAPLEPIALSQEYRSALDDVSHLAEAVTDYNSAVDRANGKIAEFKQNANPARLRSAESELRWLEIAKKRHQPAVAAACNEYQALSTEKDELEARKIEARGRLNTYGEKVCKRYCDEINRLLKRFNAGFRLDRVRVEYFGRIANSTFCVLINDASVEMGSSDTPISEPSFKNTLSAGDRSTLALAFFLAQLEADPLRGNCVVVFDDPFNSQDHFRRTCTATEIRRCGKGVSQIIVMSHDRNFLWDLWSLPLPTADRKALWLIPFGHKDTLIREWPIETDTESEDAANRRVLLRYHQDNEGDPRDVIKKLRPVVETHMQRAAPELLAGVRGLGNMLTKVRETNSPPILTGAYDEIDDINIYTRRYMHGENPKADSEPIHSTELEGMVGKALEIAGALVPPT